LIFSNEHALNALHESPEGLIVVHEHTSSEQQASDHTATSVDISPSCVRLTQVGVAEYFMRRGEEIYIDRVAGADPRLVEFYLHALAIPAILHQRGVFPVHASAIEFEGKAALLVGASGHGKSTLSASLVEYGAKLIADDQVCLYANEKGYMEAHPGLQRLHLSDDAARATGRKLVADEDRFGAKGKNYYPTLSVARVPVPVRALYFPDWTEEALEDPRFHLLTTYEALIQIRQNIYYHSFVNALGNERAFLRFAEAILAQVPCFRMYRPRQINLLQQTAIALLRHMTGLGSET
jgi:hypothetical protein